MTLAGEILNRINFRLTNPDIWTGGVYQVEQGLVDDTCNELAELLSHSGITTVVQWGQGFLIPGKRLLDVGYDDVARAFNRDERLSGGGVAIVGLRDEEFGQAPTTRIEGIARVGSDQLPKRVMALVVESHCATILGNRVEDMRWA